MEIIMVGERKVTMERNNNCEDKYEGIISKLKFWLWYHLIQHNKRINDTILSREKLLIFI